MVYGKFPEDIVGGNLETVQYGYFGDAFHVAVLSESRNYSVVARNLIREFYLVVLQKAHQDCRLEN